MNSLEQGKILAARKAQKCPYCGKPTPNNIYGPECSACYCELLEGTLIEGQFGSRVKPAKKGKTK